MKITDVRIRKITRDGLLRAVVSITFDEVFVVHDIKVIEGQKGMFIAMPSRKSSDGEFRDIVHPINQEMRDYIQDTILGAYMNEVFKQAKETENFESLVPNELPYL